MTVSSEVSSIAYAGDGVTLAFAIPFSFLANTDIEVVSRDAAGDTTVLSSGFSITGAGTGSGTCTFTTAPASSVDILIERAPTLEQPMNLTSNDSFPAATVETAHDRATYQRQFLRDLIRRCIQLPAGDESIGDAAVLGNASSRASKYLGFDADGAPELVTSLASTILSASVIGALLYDRTAAEIDTGILPTAYRYIPYEPRRYGAANDGVTDDTAALLACFSAAIPTGQKVTLRGAYLVSGAISTVTTIAAGSLHIECEGDVTITVAAGATGFATLLACYTTAANDCSISGGRLIINGNNRVGSGLYIRHAATTGGFVDIARLTVKNCKNLNASDTNENQGVLIFGRYRMVKCGELEIDTIDRTNTAAGACKGLTIDQIEGPCTIDTLKVRQVLCTGGTADADGVYLGGYTAGATYTQRSGSVSIRHLVVEDCQGRSLKAQMQEVSIETCIIYRQSVSTLGVPDIDFQTGGGNIDKLKLVYKKSGGSSLLHASFYPISVQQQCTDRVQRCTIRNVLLQAEMQLPYLAYLTVAASALSQVTEILGAELQIIGAMSGSHFSRALIECDAGAVAASTGTTHIVVRNVRGNMSAVPLIGHTAFGASVATKLSFETVGNENTGTYASGNGVLAAVSGSAITSFLRFAIRDNHHFNDYLSGITSFDYRLVPHGCRFHYNAATCTGSNGPSLGGAGIILVEVLGSISATAGHKSIRVVKDDANAANTVFQTQTGTWGTIK